MLSYQHIYHAGNRADVHKHLWLVAVLDYLRQKDKPLTWIDTHAGRGLYDLDAPEAQKLGEYKTGVREMLATAAGGPAPLETYRELIAALNKGAGGRRLYPGSAFIAAKLMRPSGRLHAFDLHKGEVEYLKTALAPFKYATVRKEDGLKALSGLLPPPSRRGGTLIDPSYEIKTEYAAVADMLEKCVKKWEQGIYMVWYPMLKSGLYESLKTRAAALPHALIDEWVWGEPETTKGMYGSGMIIVNPPYTVPETMRDIKKLLGL